MDTGPQAIILVLSMAAVDVRSRTPHNGYAEQRQRDHSPRGRRDFGQNRYDINVPVSSHVKQSRISFVDKLVVIITGGTLSTTHSEF